MSKETILPFLGSPPRGHTWVLSRIQGRVGGKFGEQGFTYTIQVYKNNKQVMQKDFFIPRHSESDTLLLIGLKEKEIKREL